MRSDMQKYKEDRLLFINTFIRRDGEPKVSEEEYSSLSKGRPHVYDVRWQSRVRKRFFNTQK